MSYVQANLMPNEQVIATGQVHWWGYVPGALFTILGLLLVIASGAFGWLLLVGGLVLLLKAWIHAFSTELAITNKRVIAKFGFIRRSTVELLHKNVESFHVDQGIIGRIFNFGTVVINGTGGVRTPIPSIAAPLEFRRQALSTIESGQS
jgi:uncharacterized membrane protein YdbT with pleckstrin-like domain